MLYKSSFIDFIGGGQKGVSPLQQIRLAQKFEHGSKLHPAFIM